MKKCSKCNEEKEFEFFGKNIELKDGFKNECKECDKKYMKEYYLNNKNKYGNHDKEERAKYNKKYKSEKS